MKNKLIKIVVLVLSFLITSTMLIGCNPIIEDMPEDVVPTVPDKVGVKLQNILDLITGTYSVDTKKSTRINLFAEGEMFTPNGTKNRVNLDMKGNLITNGEADQSSFYMRLAINGATESTIFGMYYQEEQLYLDINGNVIGINGFNLKALSRIININLNPDITVGDDVINILDIVGNALFAEEDLVIAGTKVTMRLDMVKMWNALSLVASTIDGVLCETVDGVNYPILDIPGFGEVTYNSIKTFLVANPTVIAIEIDATPNNLKMSMNAKLDNADVLNASMKNMIIENGSYQTSELTGLTEFIETKVNASTPMINLGNIDLSGQIAFGNYDRDYFAYDYKLVADMDPFEFILASKLAVEAGKPYAWIESLILSDNFFHFQISHTCTEICLEEGSMCGKKMIRPTNLIDIFFDPRTMDSSNLYINFNIRGLISNDNLDSILVDLAGLDSGLIGIVRSMVSNLLYENWLIPIDINALLEPYTTSFGSGGGTEEPDPEQPSQPTDIKGILKIVNSLINLASTGITMEDNSISIDINELTFMLINDFKIDEMLNKVLSDAYMNIDYNFINNLVYDLFSGNNTNHALNTLKLSLANISFGGVEAEDYNCYERAVVYKPNSTTELRRWQDFSSSKKPVNPVLSPVLDVADNITTFRNEIIVSKNISISSEELDLLIGSYIKYSYTTFDNTYATAKASIVGIKGLDPTLYDVNQKVVLVVTPLDGNGTLHSAFGLLTGILKMDVKLPLPMGELDYTIRLTRQEKTVINAPEIGKVYYQTTSNPEIPSKATATVFYADGTTKTMVAGVISSSLGVTENILNGNKYHLTELGDNHISFGYAKTSLKCDFVNLAFSSITSNFGTATEPYHVNYKSKAFSDTKNQVANFHPNAAVLNYNDLAVSSLPLNITDYSQMIIKDAENNIVTDVIVDGRFAKLGTYIFSVNILDTELVGYFVVDAVDSIPNEYTLSANSGGTVTITKTYSGAAPNARVGLRIGYGGDYESTKISATIGGKALSDYLIDLTAMPDDKLILKDKLVITLDPSFKKSSHYYNLAIYDLDSGHILATASPYIAKTTNGNEDILFAEPKPISTDITFEENVKMYYVVDGVLSAYESKLVNGKYVFDINGILYNMEIEYLDDFGNTRTTNAEGKLECGAAKTNISFKIYNSNNDLVYTKILNNKTIIDDGSHYTTSKTYKLSDRLNGLATLYYLEDGKYLETKLTYDTNGYCFIIGSEGGENYQRIPVTITAVDRNLLLKEAVLVDGMFTFADKYDITLSYTYNEVSHKGFVSNLNIVK